MDTGAIITGMPTVPTRKYSREDDYAAYEELIVEEAPPKLAPISGLLSQVDNYTHYFCAKKKFQCHGLTTKMVD